MYLSFQNTLFFWNKKILQFNPQKGSLEYFPKFKKQVGMNCSFKRAGWNISFKIQQINMKRFFLSKKFNLQLLESIKAELNSAILSIFTQIHQICSESAIICFDFLS